MKLQPLQVNTGDGELPFYALCAFAESEGDQEYLEGLVEHVRADGHGAMLLESAPDYHLPVAVFRLVQVRFPEQQPPVDCDGQGSPSVDVGP